MLEILIIALSAFIVAFLAIPVVINIAEKKKLYDVPDERKLHTHPIASLGGIGIFLGFIFSSLLGIKLSENPEFQYFFAAAFVIFFIGLKDDIILLSATKKFIAQIVAAAIIVHLGGLRIDSMYGIAGIGTISPIYGVPLTYVTIILIINAFNLIDGIDGLSGSLGLLATLLLGTYFYFAGLQAYAALSFSLAASIMAFLIFNYHPAQIFMGDSGSLLIGMVASILVLKFINVASSPTAVIPIASAVSVGIAILIVPLVDTLRVFAIRILKGRSPFSPDRNHVHHLLLDRGFGHASVTLICVLANISLIVFTYLFSFVGNTVLIISLFGISFLILNLLYYTLPKRKMVIHRQYVMNQARDNKRTSKVINLNTKETINAEHGS
jgi:UDP-GlcNAc:undecaprenyl-phosphate/decaprenyl-phosphate GlcNAc-1-phosphate transferase